MVRAAVPGGVLSAEQWVVMDRLATEVAANAPRGAGAVPAAARGGAQRAWAIGGGWARRASAKRVPSGGWSEK